MKKYVGFLLPAAAFRFWYCPTVAFLATVLPLVTALTPAVSSADDLDDGDLISQAEKVTPAAAQFISNVEFERMVESGALKLSTPGEIFGQVLRSEIADARNRAVIDQFIDENPNLQNLARLVDLNPTNPGTYRTPDGNYRTVLTFNNGVSQTIETNGQSTKLAALADALLTSSDPVQQLALYQSSYSRYSTLYAQLCGTTPGASGNAPVGTPSGCANLIAPGQLTNPSALRSAPLAGIQTALTTLSASALGVLRLVPTPLAERLACDLEVGASATPNINSLSGFGDQTQSPVDITPSVVGIFSNFNFPSKHLLSCVKNQGSRGTCHVFAATSAVEELIARDTGKLVNLSEQDFMENLKLLWSPSYYGDGGDAGWDIWKAATVGYYFAFEKQWDYNPSLSQPGPPAFEYQHSCENYPYPLPPGAEPGCSNSAPQAPAYCTLATGTQFICGFIPAFIAERSPYSAVAGTSIWNPRSPDGSVDLIYLSLAHNDAVVMCFNVTNNFEAALTIGVIEYSAADNMTSLGGHCVHIVGFVSNEDLAANPTIAWAGPGSGGGFFIVKNSWSTQFGDAGYGYLPVDYVKANAWSIYSVGAVNY
jgi:C1A family cysteine protease